MKSNQWKLGLGISATLILLITIFAAVTPAGSAQVSSPQVLFGMDINSMDAQKEAGVPADYATVWAGVWNLKSGWGGPNAAIDRAVDNGVTPVVHFYYWGDDVSKSCVENGCYSKLHAAQKDKAGWQRLAQELATNLNAHRDGKTVVIIIESEFNKGDIQTYEAFDGYLLEKEKFFREQIPGVQLVLGFGTWNTDAWKTFDRAAAGADFVGIQALRGSTRDSLTRYDNAVNTTLAGMNKAKTLFGKPILLTDLGLSSYPEPDYEKHQARVLGAFFSRIGELKAAGMRGMIYRSWSDTMMDTANYYGEGERHWGLVRTSEPIAKQAKAVWVNGVKAQRTSPAPVTSSAAPPTASAASTFDAKYSVSANVNEWWVEVDVDGNQAIRAVAMRVNGGAWTALALQEWGYWAKSLNVPRGSEVQFRATSTSGAYDFSQNVCWMCPTPTTSAPTPTTASPTPTTSSRPATTSAAPPATTSATPPTTTAPAFAATFEVSPNGNEWWVEVDVDANQDVRAVAVRINSGTWTALTLQDWDHWAKSMNAPRGSNVQFRAMSASGVHDLSEVVCWMCPAPSSSPAPTTSSPPPTTSAPARPADVHVEAESFTTKPIGRRQTDATASGGAFWNETQNGAIEHVVQTGAGTFDLRVRAKGDRLSGISPQMDVYVDGKLVGGARAGTTWANHTFAVSLTAGSHTIKIAYSNDYSNATGDRNLHLDRVDLTYGGT